MAYSAGVDVGSTQTKAVIINEQRQIVQRALIDTGANVTLAAQKAFRQAAEAAQVSEEEIEYVI
ncbi:MAG TPA: BadF/BadG/BcrA/BcrD ATPase family protein, partial [bacterium]|nr:BadF/BadG/BcrA/BcrD ATPase family protein [bacterium]